MSDAYFTNWLSSQPCYQRNHFHEIALHEARVASEARERPAVQTASPTLLARVRAALTGPAPIERCDCAAAA